MSNCSNCKLGSPDQVKSKGGPIYNELFDELKPYRLEYDKTYFFRGSIFYYGETLKTKCSLILSKDKFGNSQYIVQIFRGGKPSLIRPFTGICLYDNRGIISNQNGFTIQYTTVDQRLYFYTSNSNDLMGQFTLEDAIMNSGSLGLKAINGTYSCGKNGWKSCSQCGCGECTAWLLPGVSQEITTSCGDKVKVCDTSNICKGCINYNPVKK